MKTLKQFILDTLLPYKENPETCGYDETYEQCVYLTEDGRKCAVGKHMLEGSWQNSSADVGTLDVKYGLEKILKKSALEQNLMVDVWDNIQHYHDVVALNKGMHSINHAVDLLEKELNIELDELRY